MIRSMTITLISIFILTGCARHTIVFNGKTYTDKDEYTRDVISNWEAAVASITPLPHPISKRRLLVVYPTRSYYQQSRLAFTQQVTPSATLSQLEKDPNFYILYSLCADKARIVARQGIFQKVDASIVDGFAEVPPSDDYDVLMLTLASAPDSTDQWYYYSKRNGRQIISADLGGRVLAERIASFLDSIKAAALQ